MKKQRTYCRNYDELVSRWLEGAAPLRTRNNRMYVPEQGPTTKMYSYGTHHMLAACLGGGVYWVNPLRVSHTTSAHRCKVLQGIRSRGLVAYELGEAPPTSGDDVLRELTKELTWLVPKARRARVWKAHWIERAEQTVETAKLVCYRLAWDIPPLSKDIEDALTVLLVVNRMQ